MKQTDKDKRLADLEYFVQYIANSYVELSNDKVAYQYLDFIKKARELKNKDTHGLRTKSSS